MLLMEKITQDSAFWAFDLGNLFSYYQIEPRRISIFIHNHAVHDTTGINRTISKMLISAFGSICTKRATPPTARQVLQGALSATPALLGFQRHHIRTMPRQGKIVVALALWNHWGDSPTRGLIGLFQTGQKGHHLKIFGPVLRLFKYTQNEVKQFDLERTRSPSTFGAMPI